VSHAMQAALHGYDPLLLGAPVIIADGLIGRDKHEPRSAQARTGSSRLPGKVLRSLLGKPLLIRLVERVRAAEMVGTVVVATTKLREDNLIGAVCRAERIPCYHGHPTDLLDRYRRMVGAPAQQGSTS